MKLLVLATTYSKPNENPTHFFVQARNIYYKSKGIDVIVLNFSANKNYTIDGIQVITLDEYEKNQEKYKANLLISHAPNLRNHYKFLRKYEKNFEKIIFFFHGHEVLYCNKVYSKPYKYLKDSNLMQKSIRNIYDIFKLYVWRKYFTKIAYKSYFIFVSKWMYNEFFKWTKINPKVIEDRYSITYNCVGKKFEEEKYDYKSKKEYDFITIRSNLDGSKYSIDIVNELAKNNPNYKFLIVGKGKFFEFNQKSNNIEVKYEFVNHEQIIKLLNKSKCALMPTRTDAQGLMMCEMATFGIPVITSDIPVCHEVFDDFKNVKLIDNFKPNTKLESIFNELINGNPYDKNIKYFNSNTSEKEIEIFKKVLEEED